VLSNEINGGDVLINTGSIIAYLLTILALQVGGIVFTLRDLREGRPMIYSFALLSMTMSIFTIGLIIVGLIFITGDK